MKKRQKKKAKKKIAEQVMREGGFYLVHDKASDAFEIGMIVPDVRENRTSEQSRNP